MILQQLAEVDNDLTAYQEAVIAHYLRTTEDMDSVPVNPLSEEELDINQLPPTLREWILYSKLELYQRAHDYITRERDALQTAVEHLDNTTSYQAQSLHSGILEDIVAAVPLPN